MADPTPYAESNALLAMQEAMDGSTNDYAEVKKILEGMLPSELRRLADACRELAWYISALNWKV